MPISYTSSQNNELFWEGSHCLKSLVICDSRFESQIAIAIKSRDLEHLAPWVDKSWFSGRGWGQQLFNFQSPAVQWMARSSSLNCHSCRNPYQTPHSLNCLPPFHWKTLFFTETCFVASPSPKSALSWSIIPKGSKNEKKTTFNLACKIQSCLTCLISTFRIPPHK